MSKQNKLLVAALVLGVWLIVMLHSVAYCVGKARLDAGRGVGTMTDNAILAVRRRHIVHGSIHLGVWLAGVGAAKVALSLAGRRVRAGGSGGGGGSQDGKSAP